VSRSLGGRESTVRRGRGVLTLLHKDNGASKWDDSSWVSARDMASSFIRRGMDVVGRRILEIS
jgi:hypothetical protein